MDCRQFYSRLFRSVEREFGPLDLETLTGVIGFTAGGPLSLCTVGREAGVEFITYASCELAVRNDRPSGELGPYELMITVDDEEWTQSVLTNIAGMSLETVFEPGHTLDIQAWVDPGCPVQAILFEEFTKVEIDDRDYGILHCQGADLNQLEMAKSYGVGRVIQELRDAGLYPHTRTKANAR